MALQLSVFLGNHSGRFQEIASTLAEASVNILSFSLADTADYGILRIICDDPEKGEIVLRAKNIMARSTEVIVVYISPECGTLAPLLETIGRDVNISYMYPYATSGTEAGMVLKVKEADLVKERLDEAGYRHH